MQLDQLLKKTQGIPPSPLILSRMQLLLKDEDLSLMDLSSLIKIDASFTAQIIHLCNESYSKKGACLHLEHAIEVIGSKELYQFITLFCQQHSEEHPTAFYCHNEEALLMQSITCASLLEAFAIELNLDSNLAFNLGLIHTVGILLTNFALTQSRASPKQITGMAWDQKNRHLGYTYAQAASELFKKWKFPEEITQPIADHLKPETEEENTWTLLLEQAASMSATLKPMNAIEPTIINSQSGLSQEIMTQAIAGARQRVNNIQGLLRSF